MEARVKIFVLSIAVYFLKSIDNKDAISKVAHWYKHKLGEVVLVWYLPPPSLETVVLGG